MWSLHAIDYDSALKRKEVLTPAAPWMDLEDIVLSDTSQAQRQLLYDSTCVRSSEGSSPDAESRGVLIGAGGGGEESSDGDRVFVRQDEESSRDDGGDGRTVMGTYVMPLCIQEWLRW